MTLTKSILAALLIACGFSAYSQTDSTRRLSFSGYGELYYSYDFSNPDNHNKPAFIYNHNRHNEINANLLLGKVSYLDKKMRSNLGIMFGTYAQSNLAAEPVWAQFIYEANVGVKLSRKHNLWFDAGIMPSHIGAESAIGADNLTLTRSLVAESSPYFETGAKLSYTNPKEKLSLALLVLNGWQRIRRPDAIQRPSFGTQITYKPFAGLTLNYSTFLGSDKADSLSAFRSYHDVYVQYEPTDQLALIVCFDLGMDKYSTTDYGIWFTPMVTLRYKPNDHIRVALRGEYMDDSKGFVLFTETASNFSLLGLSANIDYQINRNLLLRLEGRYFHADRNVFLNDTDTNVALTTSLSVRL